MTNAFRAVLKYKNLVWGEHQISSDFSEDKKFLFSCTGWGCILVLIFPFNHRGEI